MNTACRGRGAYFKYTKNVWFTEQRAEKNVLILSQRGGMNGTVSSEPWC